MYFITLTIVQPKFMLNYNNLLAYVIKILYIIHPENFQFSIHYYLDKTTKNQPIDPYTNVSQC